jgi:hypothetical protein
METIESLVFLFCTFQKGLCLFPPKLKLLQITPPFGGDIIFIENLPESLESFECYNVHLKGSTESDFFPPSKLLNLGVSRWRDSEGKYEIEILPFDLPVTLLNLNIRDLSGLQALPSLYLGSLRSIKLSFCDSLSTLSSLPQSLFKLALRSCGQIESLNLPNGLEELSCEWCKELELDLPDLPPQLQKLSIKNCDRMEEVTQLDQLPIHLKDLELGGFDSLVNLPSLPSGLHSLCLKQCDSLALLPILPESLRKLALEKLSALETMAPLPDNLEEFTLEYCEKLKELDHIPHKLRSLKITSTELLQILSFDLPRTLEHLEISKSPNIESGFEKYLIEMGSHAGSPFPPNLRVLELRGFKSLKILSTLPIYLEKFVLSDCESIIEFPSLPPSLKELNIHYCDQIKFVGSDDIPLEGIGFHGKIPTSLKEIVLNSQITNLD